MKKKTTIVDIAAVLGISPKAVSTGINNSGRLSPTMRAKILQTAKELNYIPNLSARSLVTNKSYLVGALIPYLNRSFFGSIIAGIEEIADIENFSLMLGNSDGDPATLGRVIDRMIQRQIDGIILYVQPEHIKSYQRFSAANIPIVQIMTSNPEIGDKFIAVDNYKAAQNAILHLVECGHRNIGMLNHNHESHETRLRYDAFIDISKELQLPFNPEEQSIECSIDIDDAAQKTEMLLAKYPKITAIFACTDMTGLGALKTLLNKKIKVPDDFAVIGYDGIDSGANQLVYPLTTMSQPKEKIGIEAGEMLFSLLKGKNTQSQLLEANLVVRATTAKC
jgi:DNA-binding LacI/PurR family transcriptional regulator